MHTFFINTSKKPLDGYEVLFDIHTENKKLILMDCPMSDWYDKDNGYVACVKQMSDMIDGYVELNNAFNLIVYIDLAENKAYSSIKRDAYHDKERESCCLAMHILFTHVITESMVDELINSGRRPQNVLIMFGEEKRFVTFNVASNDPGREDIRKRLFGFMGLPDADVVESIAKEVKSSEVTDDVATFEKKIIDACGEELVPGIRQRYMKDIQLWSESIITEENVDRANTELFDRVDGIKRVESEMLGVEMVSCPYDCYACLVNKSALALSKLNIALHVLKCVELGSVYIDTDISDKPQVVPFHLYTVEEIAGLLKTKEALYAAKATEVEELAQSYPDLGLAPRLFALDHDKFGLDENGSKAFDFLVVDTEEEESENGLDKDGEEETTVSIKNSKETVIIEKLGRSLIPQSKLKTMDYTCDEDNAELLRRNVKPERYVAQAGKVRKHHLNYLKNLSTYINEALSNYAGKSKANKPAVLKIGGNRYAKAEYEEKSVEAVENVSQKAYDTVMNQYLEFCAARSVAITDIEEECNYFISTIHQISECLKKIKLAAVGLFAAIIALYIPFFVIQFEAITENVLTFTYALGSFALPVVLLYAVFIGVTVAWKRKYVEAWTDFKARADAVLEENAVAAKKFNKLLSVAIPALRWVYEYKLDVDYCAECCQVADAKVEHHRRKLRDRVTAIVNILGDLEYLTDGEEDRDVEVQVNGDEIDYNVPFCTSKKNIAFYTVIDEALLGLKDEEGGAQG